MAGYCTCVRPYFHEPEASTRVQYPAILPSQPRNRFIIYHSDFSSIWKIATAIAWFKGRFCVHI